MSGIRFRNHRLVIAVRKLAKNSRPYANFISGRRKYNAVRIIVSSVATDADIWSPDTYRPRTPSGIQWVIHGRNPHSDIPRDALNTNSRSSISAIRVVALTFSGNIATPAMPSMNAARNAHPRNTNARYPILSTNCAAGICSMFSNCGSASTIPSTVADAPSLLKYNSIGVLNTIVNDTVLNTWNTYAFPTPSGIFVRIWVVTD